MSGQAIAMWSGPRNISTAMMRAWENRPDTDVVDEPLYAHYLQATGIDHPGREEVLRSQSGDWREVVSRLTAPIPEGRILYQKQMAHHLTPDISLEWVDGLTNVFLIRDPDDVVRSYSRIRAAVDPQELGFPQQVRLFERVRSKTGATPPVIDARDVLLDPAGVLRALCQHLRIPFDVAMLSWPAGPRASDGVWAPWWYASVERSTGFAPYRPRRGALTETQRALAAACRPAYEMLAEHRILPG